MIAFHVWLYHPDGSLPGPRQALGDKVMFELNLGLICFFVLSGFLLYRPFATAALSGSDRIDLRTYALRRAARILPAYYACLAGALLLYEAVGAAQLVPPAGQVLRFLYFGQSYWANTLTAVDAVTWTLCIEVAFYVLLPVLGWVALRVGPRRIGAQVAFLAALVGVSAAWNAAANLSGWGPVATKSLPAYIGDFALGMLAALWVAHRGASGRGQRALAPGRGLVLALAGAGIVVANGYWHERWGSHTVSHQVLMDLPAAAGFALLIAAVSAGANPAASLLATRPLVAAGRISYGLYLWHIPLILALTALGLLPGDLLARLVLVLGVTVLAAWASWRAIERPALLWAHRDRRRTPAPRLAPAAAGGESSVR